MVSMSEIWAGTKFCLRRKRSSKFRKIKAIYAYLFVLVDAHTPPEYVDIILAIKTAEIVCKTAIFGRQFNQKFTA